MTKRDSEDAGMAASRQRAEADVAFVEALARVLKDNDLAEIEVTREYGEDDELQVRLSRYAAAAMPMMAPPPALPAPSHAPSAAPAAVAAPVESDPGDHPGCVPSPMVGTVYLAAEPGAPVFVSEGDRVEEGQTLLIVEAMKTMNHIPSPRAGVVKKILVSNEQPVEYGSPLMIVE
jgi:acetyl-CoA carboxylase biotin carboxyl carrier protein